MTRIICNDSKQAFLVYTRLAAKNFKVFKTETKGEYPQVVAIASTREQVKEALPNITGLVFS